MITDPAHDLLSRVTCPASPYSSHRYISRLAEYPQPHLAPPTVMSDDKEIVLTADQSPNREGTAHQSALGPKPKRKHFFSPLDSTYADAVNLDAESVEFTPEEDVRVDLLS